MYACVCVNTVTCGYTTDVRWWQSVRWLVGDEVRVCSTGGSQAASSSTGTTSAQLQSQLSNLQHNILQQQSQQQQQQPSLVLPHESPHHTHSSLPPASQLPEEGMVREHHQPRERDGNESPLSDNDMSPRSSWSAGFVVVCFFVLGVDLTCGKDQSAANSLWFGS